MGEFVVPSIVPPDGGREGGVPAVSAVGPDTAVDKAAWVPTGVVSRSPHSPVRARPDFRVRYAAAAAPAADERERADRLTTPNARPQASTDEGGKDACVVEVAEVAVVATAAGLLLAGDSDDGEPAAYGVVPRNHKELLAAHLAKYPKGGMDFHVGSATAAANDIPQPGRTADVQPLPRVEDPPERQARRHAVVETARARLADVDLTPEQHGLVGVLLDVRRDGRMIRREDYIRMREIAGTEDLAALEVHFGVIGQRLETSGTGIALQGTVRGGDERGRIAVDLTDVRTAPSGKTASEARGDFEEAVLADRIRVHITTAGPTSRERLKDVLGVTWNKLDAGLTWLDLDGDLREVDDTELGKTGKPKTVYDIVHENDNEGGEKVTLDLLQEQQAALVALGNGKSLTALEIGEAIQVSKVSHILDPEAHGKQVVIALSGELDVQEASQRVVKLADGTYDRVDVDKPRPAEPDEIKAVLQHVPRNSRGVLQAIAGGETVEAMQSRFWPGVDAIESRRRLATTVGKIRVALLEAGSDVRVAGKVEANAALTAQSLDIFTSAPVESGGPAVRSSELDTDTATVIVEALRTGANTEESLRAATGLNTFQLATAVARASDELRARGLGIRTDIVTGRRVLYERVPSSVN